MRSASRPLPQRPALLALWGVPRRRSPWRPTPVFSCASCSAAAMDVAPRPPPVSSTRCTRKASGSVYAHAAGAPLSLATYRMGGGCSCRGWAAFPRSTYCLHTLFSSAARGIWMQSRRWRRQLPRRQRPLKRSSWRHFPPRKVGQGPSASRVRFLLQLSCSRFLPLAPVACLPCPPCRERMLMKRSWLVERGALHPSAGRHLLHLTLSTWNTVQVE